MSSNPKYPRGHFSDDEANPHPLPGSESLPQSGFQTPNAAEKPSTVGGVKAASGYFAPDEMPIPEKLGIFRIVKVLRSGGMGMVLEGVDDNLGRSVAIKVIKPGTAVTPAARER